MAEGLSNIDASQLSDSDKRELQTFISHEQQKASMQESTQSTP